jgi:DNA-binding GntR family transcriptional regulator
MEQDELKTALAKRRLAAPPPTRASAVAQTLKELILRGELPPGARLRQNDIAEMLGVSSTPVREALLALSRVGLVLLDAHKGAIVFAPSIDDVRENFEIRAALECLAVQHAAKNITEADLADLEDVSARMASCESLDERAVLNARFHGIINSASGLRQLVAMLETLRESAAAYHVVFNTRQPSEHRRATILAEHAELLAALRARDPDRAARAAKLHVDGALSHVLQSMSQSVSARAGQPGDSARPAIEAASS